MSEFEHERPDVYRIAIEFLALADAVAAALPTGRVLRLNESGSGSRSRSG